MNKNKLDHEYDVVVVRKNPEDLQTNGPTLARDAALTLQEPAAPRAVPQGEDGAVGEPSHSPSQRLLQKDVHSRGGKCQIPRTVHDTGERKEDD